jgi:hypothetical protein
MNGARGELGRFGSKFGLADEGNIYSRAAEKFLS